NEGDEAGHVGVFIRQGQNGAIPFTTSDQAMGFLGVYSGPDLMSIKVIKPDGTTVGPVTLNSQAADNDVAVEHHEEGNGLRSFIVAIKRPLSGQWQLIVSGVRVSDGHIDLWSVDDGAISFDASLVGSRGFCATPGTARLGITVANYITKTQWPNIN